MMWWNGAGMGGWGYALMTISTVLFWALIILAIVALIRYVNPGRATGPERSDPSTDGAEQVLARRFAAGEIDEQEYHRRGDVLRGRAQRQDTPSAG